LHEEYKNTRSRGRPRDDGDDNITDWTGKILTECAAAAAARDWKIELENTWCVVPRSPTFSNEDGMTTTTMTNWTIDCLEELVSEV